MNPHIGHHDFSVVTQRQAFPLRSEVARAGVSSFGSGGTNVHVVLQGAPEQRVSLPERPAYLICLSAKSEDALQQRMDDLANWLNAETSLAELEAALLGGRAHYSVRTAMVVSDLTALRHTLQTRPL